MPKPRIDFNRAALLKAQGLTYAEIAEVMGVNKGSLRVGMCRTGIAKQINVSRETRIAQAQEVANSLLERGKRVRDGIAGQIEASVNVLAAKPVQDPGELANTPEGQGRASVLKTLTDAAKVAFDWDSGNRPGLLQVNVLAAIKLDQLDAEPVGSETVDPSRHCDKTLYDQ